MGSFSGKNKVKKVKKDTGNRKRFDELLKQALKTKVSFDKKK